MQLNEIMTPQVEHIDLKRSVQEAAHTMAAVNIGFLLVTDEGQPVGVLTDRDIVVRGVAEGKPVETTVEEVYTPLTEMLEGTATVEEAAALMKAKQIRRVLVRGESGEVAGVISLGDLACDLGEDTLSGGTLEAISEPSTPIRLKG